MLRSSRAVRAAGCGIAGVLLVTSSVYAAPDAKRRARTAVRYVAEHQKPNGSIPSFSTVGSTADAVVAMVAARRAPKQIDKALDYLARQVKKGNVTGTGPTAKVVLAVTAGGRKPHRFGGANLVRALRRSKTPEGLYGEGAAVFDHALAMLALAGAGSAPAGDAVSWLAAAQCGDGGWQYDAPPGPDDDEHCVGPADDFFASDTNTTALAVQAFAAVSGAAEPVADPFAFLAAIRDDEFGGWGYSWGFETTDANSTSLVLQAYTAAGRDLPAGAGRALKRLQYRLCGPNGGAFAFTWVEAGDGGVVKSGPDVGATIGAIPGLLRKPLPVTAVPVTKPAPKRRAC